MQEFQTLSLSLKHNRHGKDTSIMDTTRPHYIGVHELAFMVNGIVLDHYNRHVASINCSKTLRKTHMWKQTIRNHLLFSSGQLCNSTTAVHTSCTVTHTVDRPTPKRWAIDQYVISTEPPHMIPIASSSYNAILQLILLVQIMSLALIQCKNEYLYVNTRWVQPRFNPILL